MTKKLQWFVSRSMIVSSGVGICISLACLVLLWVVMPRLREGVNFMSDFASVTLENATSLLTLVDTTITNSEDSIERIEKGSLEAAKSLTAANAFVNDLTQLTGDDFPSEIAEMQTSLDTMQQSAQVIDETLLLVTKIPLLSLTGPYAPKTTLSASIETVSQTIDRFPHVFERMNSSLKAATGDLESLQKNVQSLSKDISDIKTSITVVKKVVRDYREKITDANERMTKIKPILNNSITALGWGGSLIFLWMLFSQVSRLLEGIEKTHSS